MEEIVNLIATDSSASKISDSIKNAIFAKAAERIDALKPVVAGSMFDQGEQEDESETEEE